MQFLCFGYFNAQKMDDRPEEEIEAILSECPPHLEEFYDSGQVKLDSGLDKESKYLQRKHGKMDVTDGPFIETKELIGSAFLIEAEDMEEAIQIAALHPTIQVKAGEQFDWGIEIRPIHYWKSFNKEV
ncbi:YciI family protein [Halobacillus massiliensis]|uniref:YciI family protein n=1 Tax=Halobacillus massiliensis TaxID=1926286 RepID=UPI0009E32622|nr:YciI family protein [Halobacillus massiliensis]